MSLKLSLLFLCVVLQIGNAAEYLDWENSPKLENDSGETGNGLATAEISPVEEQFDFPMLRPLAGEPAEPVRSEETPGDAQRMRLRSLNFPKARAGRLGNVSSHNRSGGDGFRLFGRPTHAPTQVIRHRLFTPDRYQRKGLWIPDIGFPNRHRPTPASAWRVFGNQRPQSRGEIIRDPVGAGLGRFKGRVPQGASSKGIISYKIVRGSSPNPFQSVSIKCGDQKLRVAVNKDFFGTGTQLQASEVSLGSGCPSNGVESAFSNTIVFEYDLHACGSKRTITDPELIYSNTIYYRPAPGSSLTQPQSVNVECRYIRSQTISSNKVQPTWVPMVSTRSFKNKFAFSFTVMNADWSAGSESSDFRLGESINFQASVDLQNHQGLKIYIDRCVATTSSNASSEPNYDIIRDYGLAEGSPSRFVSPRSSEVLRFQMKAFQFESSPEAQIYIHCLLRVSEDTDSAKETLKSCTYDAETESWTELEGRESLCDCCETECVPSSQTKRSAALLPSTLRKSDFTIGPLRVLDPGSSPSSVSFSSSREISNQTLWRRIREQLEGASEMEVAQLFATVAAAVCAFCILLGILCLCRRFSLKSTPDSSENKLCRK
ncbi:UNVERIFIED_CONTAM: hypothetical protein FKN15_025107 [Acipenser sinensis]